MSELCYKKSGSRITIILEDTIEGIIKRLQKELVEKNGKPYSLTKIINTLLVAGMMASEKLTISDWFELKKYFQNERITYDEKLMKVFLENLL